MILDALSAVPRWTPLLFAAPRRFVERSEFWAGVNLHHWSESDYVWIQDDLNGYADTVRDPRATYERGEGDCEDYALVAACVLHSRGCLNLKFVVLSRGYLPEHTVLYDANRHRVYSSGQIHDQSLEEYLDSVEYTRYWTRRV